MVIPIREQLRVVMLRYVEQPGARSLRALGLTPNAVTLIGFAITLGAAYLVGSDRLLAGGIVFLLGGSLDLLDGALARLTGRVSSFGALLDSVLDRLGEASLFVGLAVYGLRAGFSPAYLQFFILVVLLALILSQTVSYLRARGEGLGAVTTSGLMTRPERVVLLGAGLIAHQVPWVLLAILLIITVVSGFTLLQRLFTIRGLLNKGG